MLVRIISAVVAIPILLFFIIKGGLPLICVAIVISLIGMGELYKAVSGKLKAVHTVGFLLEIAYGITIVKFYLAGSVLENSAGYLLSVFAALTCATLLILVILVFGHRTNNIYDGAITLFGFFYVGVLLSLIFTIRQYAGLTFAWLPFLFSFGSDTGAYFIGSRFGRHKLTPELSPKKSVEGAIGGVVTVMLLTTIFFLCYNNIYTPIATGVVVLWVVVSAIAAVLSQIGDLAASSIKRFTGIKDYGKIMPGHGGVLDRFDSVLFTLPVVFATLVCIGLFL